MKGIPVTFDRAEVLNGAFTGVMRRVNGLFGAAQTVPEIDGAGKGWVHDIESALSERAVAKALNRYWDSSLGRYRDSAQGDVGSLQIRWTQHEAGHLPIRAHDKPDFPYMLVVGLAPNYRVVGWIPGAEAMVDEYLTDPGNRGKPCWWIPQSALTEVRQ